MVGKKTAEPPAGKQATEGQVRRRADTAGEAVTSEFVRRLGELLRSAPSEELIESWQRDFARMGRPMRESKVTGERVPLSLRVTPDMKARLDKAALKSGRSQSQEAEIAQAIVQRDHD